MLLRIFLLTSFGALCFAQPTRNPFASDSKAAEAGRWAFRIHCSPCHGIRAEGGRGPDLTRGTYTSGDQDADLFRVISQGVPGTEMPAFSGIEDEGIWQMVSYLRSVARHDAGRIPGDAASGEKIFWSKGGCGQCHKVGAKGNGIGPDLSRAGRQRSFAYLRESVLKPDADITAGFATITVVTRDGKTITGVQRGFDNFSGQLVDLSGHYYSFFKEDVTSMKREFRSLMPSTYGQLLSQGEMNDLIAYLSSLRGER